MMCPSEVDTPRASALRRARTTTRFLIYIDAAMCGRHDLSAQRYRVLTEGSEGIAGLVGTTELINGGMIHVKVFLCLLPAAETSQAVISVFRASLLADEGKTALGPLHVYRKFCLEAL